MSKHLSDLWHELATKPWMMQPRRLATLAQRVIAMRPEDLAGLRATAEAAALADQTPAVAIQGAVAVIPVRGMITHRADFWSWLFGGTSVEALLAKVRQYRDDPAVRAIVLDIDSPGGSVDGVPETFDELMSVRGKKPFVAVANCLSASAAYYLSAAADEIVVSPSAEVGSIGVYSLYINEQKFWESMGVDIEVIRAGARKIEANPWEPLTDEARAELKAGVDYFYDLFVKAVAKGRGRSVSEIRGEAFGEGLVFRPKDAVANGLADRVATLDAVIAKLAGSRRGSRAAADESHEPAMDHGEFLVTEVRELPVDEPVPAAGDEVSASAAADATTDPQAAAPRVPAARLALEREIAIEELG